MERPSSAAPARLVPLRGGASGEARAELRRARAEHAFFVALSVGDLDEARRQLAVDGHRELFRLLGEADIRLHALDIDVPELQVLRVHVEEAAGERSDLAAWAVTLVAERLLVAPDLTAYTAARTAVDAMPEPDGTAPLVALYSRARLLRVLATSFWFLPGLEEFEQHRAWHDEAVRCLLRCEFPEEVAATIGLTAGLRALGLNEDPYENYQRVQEARAVYADNGVSGWALVLDIVLAVLALALGDAEGASAASARIERARVVPPPLDLVPSLVRALMRAGVEGPTDAAVDALEAAFGSLRAYPRVGEVFAVAVAHGLADVGSAHAVRFARRALELPPSGPVDTLTQKLLRFRVAALTGEPRDDDEVMGVLEELAAAGHGRNAARFALGLAWDSARAGCQEAAERFHAWGLGHVPGGDAMTAGERLLSRPLPSAVPSAAASGGDAAARPALAELAVLTARLRVTVADRVVPVGDAASALLVALVVAHPAPLHVERLVDGLWPEVPLDKARSRLTTTTHRLRRALGPAGAGLVRTGDLLALDDRMVHADLWTYRAALDGDDRTRAAAVASVRGALCATQLPYQEHLVDERERFLAEWTAHARGLLARGALTLTHLTPALRALGLPPQTLDDV